MVSINSCMECTNFVSASRVLRTACCVPSRFPGMSYRLLLPPRQTIPCRGCPQRWSLDPVRGQACLRSHAQVGRHGSRLTPGVTERGRFHVHSNASRGPAGGVMRRGVRGTRAVPAAARRFLDRLGLGYGSSQVTCDTCRRVSRQGGVTGFVKLGAAPSRNLLIGAALNGWAHSDGSATETMANVTASLYLYPRRRSGFFVTGGGGVSHHHIHSPPPWGGTGGGFTAGARYDLPFGRDA